jgi:glycosyltransferase involved in cell wall biosynthesis
MARGLPTIVYDSPVHREYLADLGVYVPSGDVTALAEEIGESLLRTDGSKDLGVKLRERASRKYSWIKAGETILNLYRNLSDPDDQRPGLSIVQ